jgi:hypothetical protein
MTGISSGLWPEEIDEAERKKKEEKHETMPQEE